MQIKNKNSINKNILIILITIFCLTSVNIYLYMQEKSTNILYSSLQNELNDLNINLDEIISQNNKINEEIQILRSRTKYNLRNITLNNLTDFLKLDKTDENDYIYNNYECVHFASEVNNNAEKNGIKCAYVKIDFNSGNQHAIVAFNTTDNGIVFVEPQTDQIISLKIGNIWKDCVPDANYPDINDDVINKITLYW